MSKRKVEDEDVEMVDDELVNVDFDFFDFVEDDFLSIKNLLRQLFSLDNTKFNTSGLAQLVLDSKTGSTVKADDEEYNDVLAMISVVPYDAKNKDLEALLKYWIDRTTAQDTVELNRALRRIAKDSPKEIGILFSERLLNMPYEIVPPLYKLLSDELAESKKYKYLLIPSRVYSEQEPAEDLKTETKQPSAKRKAHQSKEMYPFHPEDDALSQFAVGSGTFPLETPIEETESRRAFQENGIYPYGHLTIVEFSKLAKAAEAIASLT